MATGYTATFARLRLMFRARGVPPEDAADLAQETAARFLAHLRAQGIDPRFEQDAVAPLINRIAANLIIDRARAASSRNVSLEGLGSAVDPARISLDDPAEQVEDVDRAREVRAAIASLSDRHRRAIAMSLDGKGPAEIAEDLGILRNAADALLYRARRRLAASLQGAAGVVGALVTLLILRARSVAQRAGFAGNSAQSMGFAMHLATGALAAVVATGATFAGVSAAPASNLFDGRARTVASGRASALDHRTSIDATSGQANTQNHPIRGAFDRIKGRLHGHGRLKHLSPSGGSILPKAPNDGAVPGSPTGTVAHQADTVRCTHTHCTGGTR